MTLPSWQHLVAGLVTIVLVVHQPPPSPVVGVFVLAALWVMVHVLLKK